MPTTGIVAALAQRLKNHFVPNFAADFAAIVPVLGAQNSNFAVCYPDFDCLAVTRFAFAVVAFVVVLNTPDCILHLDVPDFVSKPFHTA